MAEPRRIRVINEDADYILEDEAKDTLTLDDDGSGWGTLRFFTWYHKPFDEDGYHPPKYLNLDGVIDDEVSGALTGLGIAGDAYRFEDGGNTCGYEMDTFYVLPVVRESIERSELKQQRMTCFTVRVSPVAAKQEIISVSSSSSSDEDEPAASNDDSSHQRKKTKRS